MDIIYLGRYSKDEIPDGPEKVAKRIFDNYTLNNESLFIEYFFDGRKYGFFKKLFGKETAENINGSKVWRMGVFPLFFTLIIQKPKIIHVLNFERFALVAFFCKIFFKTKIFYSLHGLAVYENKYFRKQNWIYNLKDKITEKIFIRYSDSLLILSESFGKLLKDYYNIDERKIRFVKNGIDEEFALAGKKKIFAGSNNLKIVFISDIKRIEKGFSFLKDTLEKLDFEIELYIVSKKYSEQNFEFENKLIKVFYKEKMKPAELAEFLSDKDVFISSSRYEPFGITTVEAMAAGLIPVVTIETGASEIVENGKNGFVYDYGDDKKLKNILSVLTYDKELREKISKEAIEMYSMLSWEKITDYYTKIYKSL